MAHSTDVRVAGVVLAAGAGRRFGKPKALVRYHGALLVEHAARTLSTAGCSPVLVIVGAARREVREQAHLPGARIVSNPNWASGMGSSLRNALDALTGTDAVAAVILPVDMPGVTAEAVRRVAAHATEDVLAAATYDTRRGHPVLLGKRHWPGIQQAAVGDRGARDYLNDHDVTPVRCEDVSENFDIDRPTDLWES